LIRSLDFAEPFYQVDYIENEDTYPVGSRSILLNMSESPLEIIGSPLPFLHSTIVREVTIRKVTKALIVKNFEQCCPDDPDTFSRLVHSWKSLWEYSGLERNRGIPYYKSPRAAVGNIGMNFCLAEAGIPSAIHQKHEQSFEEIHLQICGTGKVQKLSANDPRTVYQEYALCPGTTHEPLSQPDGEYPWHNYYSISRGIFIVIEMKRGGEG